MSLERECRALVAEFGPGLCSPMPAPETMGGLNEAKPLDRLLAESLLPWVDELSKAGGPGLRSLARMPEMLSLRAGDVRAMSWSWMAPTFIAACQEGADPGRAVPALLAPWLMPGAASKTHGRRSKGAWVCMAEALSARGQEEAACAAAFQALSRFGDASGAPDCESSSEAIGLSLGRALPATIRRAIDAAAPSLATSFVPTWASRLGNQFEEAWRRRPELGASIDEAALLYLDWCQGVDMEASDYPAFCRWPAIWGCMVAREALAPKVAELWRARVAIQGERLSKTAVMFSQALLGDISMSDGDSPLWELGWAGRLFTPVDQALFAGSLDGARALRARGVPWDDDSFAELVAGLSRLDGLRSETEDEPSMLVSRARAVGEALAMEESVGQGGAKTARRI